MDERSDGMMDRLRHALAAAPGRGPGLKRSNPATRPGSCAKAAIVTRLTANARLLARDAFVVLATLAIALRIMIPAGFMTAPEPRNGAPFALVLCTGQGPLVVPSGERLSHHDKAPTDKSGHDAPCPFANHGVAAPAPSALSVAKVQFVAFTPAPPVRVAHLAPGRGLAAPPLPARGPPSQLI